MDRLAEYCDLAGISKERRYVEIKSFYMDIYSEIKRKFTKASKIKTQKSILQIESELEEFIKKSTTILDSIDLKGAQDLISHFEGIKYILKKEMVLLSRKIAEYKRIQYSSEINLIPEKPQETIKVDQSLALELENRKIVETSQYEETRQRLMKIDAVQKAIQENLLIQDERIDSIGLEHESTAKIYSDLLGDDDFSSGSFTRRATSTIIQCLSFTLIFVYFFTRV